MFKLCYVKIERYRSINSIELNINTDNSMVAICGQNNVGKTNTLRAIEYFFIQKNIVFLKTNQKLKKHRVEGQFILKLS